MWLKFEVEGSAGNPERIGKAASALSIGPEALLQLDDPLAVLGALWGVGLGNLIRDRRGDRSLDWLAESGVSKSSLMRRERAQTHPRNRAQLAAVLTALEIDPFEAIKHALWPPRSLMVELPPLGALLAAKRAQLGVSLRVLAAEKGWDASAFNAWERGRSNPSSEWRPAVAEFRRYHR